MSKRDTFTNLANPTEEMLCSCGHAVDSHTHPSKMSRDPNTGEVAEQFGHGRCTVNNCGCSEFKLSGQSDASPGGRDRNAENRLVEADKEKRNRSGVGVVSDPDF